MSAYYNKHYIATDAQGRIVDGWSDGPYRGRDAAGAVCIKIGRASCRERV